jgi:hypothetical protein
MQGSAGRFGPLSDDDLVIAAFNNVWRSRTAAPRYPRFNSVTMLLCSNRAGRPSGNTIRITTTRQEATDATVAANDTS